MKINRFKFFVGLVLGITTFGVLMNEISKISKDLYYLFYLIYIIYILLLSNARLNDIRVTKWDKRFYLICTLIPGINIYPILKMLFKKGYEQRMLDEERESLEIESKKISLNYDLKKFWILAFLLISLLICIFYVPYEIKTSNGVSKPIGNSTIFEPPKKYATRPTYIIYEEIVFREFIILAVCGTGYLVSTIIKKK